MRRSFITKIQKRIIKLLKADTNKTLQMLAKDNCSELSRIVGCWVLGETQDSKIHILKGNGVGNKKGLCHDILAIEENGKLYLIDPSVWQFFKNKKSILMGEFDDIKDSIIFAEKLYKGKWKISEILKTKSCSEKNKKEWLEIVDFNRKQ